MKFHLFVNELAHGPLNSHWQELIRVKLLIWSLGGSRPQERVVARQQHLQEVMIIELSIAVQVEVVHEKNEVFWRHLSVAIFSLELAEFLGSDEAGRVSINSLESGIGLKISDSGQNLSHFFDGQLLISNEQQQLL